MVVQYNAREQKSKKNPGCGTSRTQSSQSGKRWLQSPRAHSFWMSKDTSHLTSSFLFSHCSHLRPCSSIVWGASCFLSLGLAWIFAWRQPCHFHPLVLARGSLLFLPNNVLANFPVSSIASVSALLQPDTSLATLHHFPSMRLSHVSCQPRTRLRPSCASTSGHKLPAGQPNVCF